MKPQGYKTVTRGYNTHDRSVINFSKPVEVGINVPMLDHKFLSAYKILTTTGCDEGANLVNVNQIIGNEIPTKNIFDFDGNMINNGFFGKSSRSGYKESYSIRPTRKEGTSILASDFDTLGNSISLPFGMNNHDSIISAIQPQGIVEVFSDTFPGTQDNDDLGNQIASNFTVRKPSVMNVHDHANTLIGNVTSNVADPQQRKNYMVFPLTNRGSINPGTLYRFSFYYRLYGDINLKAYVQYFTNSKGYMGSELLKEISMIGTADERTDFSSFDALIPSVSKKNKIPETARRLRIILEFHTYTDTVFEMAYPILEHSYNNSPAVSAILPECPSSIKVKDINSSALEENAIGINYAFDETKLFVGHVGRNFFDFDLSYSLMDSNIVNELRIIEHFNRLGDTVVIRPQHHDLPPVLLGDLLMTNTNNLFDYHYNDVSINFKECV